MLKTGPRLQACCATKLGQLLTQRFGGHFWFCLRILVFLQGDRDFQKQKTQKTGLFLTQERANIGPVFNSTAVVLLSAPSLALSGIIAWAKYVSLSGPNLFLKPFYSGFIHFCTQLSFCVSCPQLSGNFLKIAFFSKGCKNVFLFFSKFSVLCSIFENSFLMFVKTL